MSKKMNGKTRLGTLIFANGTDKKDHDVHTCRVCGTLSVHLPPEERR